MNTIGVYGLGTMGQSLTKNLLNKGYTVAAYNYEYRITEQFKNTYNSYENLNVYKKLEDFVHSLEVPRKIILMITAGSAIDDVLSQLLPFLSDEDIVIDGGNSYYKDTERRINKLNELNVKYLGIGISGGEKGALEGPSMMVGGDYEAYQNVEKILENIAAKTKNQVSCCAFIGKGGAGHYTKMVHNGIEYAIIQIICEIYDLLRKVYGYSAPQIAEIFTELNNGILASYLIQITGKILKQKDTLASGYLVDKILDKASQKGTGKWTCVEGIKLDIAIPTIIEAVCSRLISNDYDTRNKLNNLYKTTYSKERSRDRNVMINQIEASLFIANICIYDQAFKLLKKADQINQWSIDASKVAAIWKNGCIIRAEILDDICNALLKDDKNLLLNETFKNYIVEHKCDFDELCSNAILHNVSIPCLASANAYLNEYINKDSSANLLQAQRDFFGAHTYERKDRNGTYHTIWE